MVCVAVQRALFNLFKFWSHLSACIIICTLKCIYLRQIFLILQTIVMVESVPVDQVTGRRLV